LICADAGFIDVGELHASSDDGMLPPPSPTPILYDRRAMERRAMGLVPEAIERKSERREEERRSSPRVPRRLWVVDSNEAGVPKVFEGEVGLGGASWNTAFPPLSEHFEVRFRVPDHDEEVKLPARLARVVAMGDDNRVQVVFTDLPLRHELAIARYLDDCVTGR
jgi:hypothetical protein